MANLSKVSVWRNGIAVKDIIGVSLPSLLRRVVYDNRHTETSERKVAGSVLHLDPFVLSTLSVTSASAFVEALILRDVDDYVVAFEDGATFLFSADVGEVSSAPAPVDGVQALEVQLFVIGDVSWPLPPGTVTPPGDFLLLEDGTPLLLETGEEIGV